MASARLDEHSDHTTLNLYATIILVIWTFIFIYIFIHKPYSRKIINTYTWRNEFVRLSILLINNVIHMSEVNPSCATHYILFFIISFNTLKTWKRFFNSIFTALTSETFINFTRPLSQTASYSKKLPIIFLICLLTLSGIEKHQCWNLDAKILIFYPFPARVLYWFPFASRTGWPDSDCTEPILNRWWQLELTLEDRSLNQTTTDGFVSFNSSREEKGGVWNICPDSGISRIICMDRGSRMLVCIVIYIYIFIERKNREYVFMCVM